MKVIKYKRPAKVVKVGKAKSAPPPQERKINGPPTNRQIYDKIHEIPVPELVAHYDAIREKRSTLPTIQRAIVIHKIKEYIQLGIVKVEGQSENNKELVNS